MFDAKEHPFGEHIERIVPLLNLDIPDRSHRSAYAGIVEHNIDLAKRRRCQSNHGLNIGFFGNVCFHKTNRVAMACICGFSHNCGTVCLVKIRNHHPRALVQKTQDGRASHTAGPASDNRDLSFESHAAPFVFVSPSGGDSLYPDRILRLGDYRVFQLAQLVDSDFDRIARLEIIGRLHGKTHTARSARGDDIPRLQGETR